MAVKRVQSNINVVTAAKQRIKNVFSNGVPVYLSFSGGKDSIVLAHLTYQLIQAGEIDPSLLTVFFIDEEAILFMTGKPMMSGCISAISMSISRRSTCKCIRWVSTGTSCGCRSFSL